MVQLEIVLICAREKRKRGARTIPRITFVEDTYDLTMNRKTSAKYLSRGCILVRRSELFKHEFINFFINIINFIGIVKNIIRKLY